MTIRKWGTEQLVNTVTTSDQAQNDVVALQDGGFAVVWHDNSGEGTDTAPPAIKMQRFDAAGNKAGGEILVNTTTTGGQFDPAIALMNTGALFIAWEDNSAGTLDIRYRRFDTSGNALDVTDRVLSLANAQDQPTLDDLSVEGVVLAFNDLVGANRQVLLQLYDGDGNPIIGPVTVANTAGIERDPVVARLLGDNSFVVVWTNTTTNEIELQRVNSNGTLNGAVVQIANAPNSPALPQVLALANGGYVVAWHDDVQPYPDTLNAAVRAQIFTGTGTASGGEFTVNTFAPNNQTTVKLAATPDGGFVAVWFDTEIRGQFFNPTGVRIGTEFIVNTTGNLTQNNPEVAVLADGRIVVTWDDFSNSGGDTDGAAIRMQIIDPRDGHVTGSLAGQTLLGHDQINDEINGLGGDDTLNGLGGADFMYGGENNDTYIVDNAGDKAIELLNQGTDVVQSAVSFTLGDNVEELTLTGAAAINGTGNGLGNILTGNSAANTLSGLGGVDTLIGGGGNDTYIFSIGDTITEAANGGTDTVQSAVKITLGNNLENLTLTGSVAINGAGNALANIITGNSAANTLTGLGGVDRLNGGLGDDTYVVDAGDIITEAVNGGVDRVNSATTFTLAANVERLTLTGAAAANGTGNALANLITGNSAANTLNGGLANDQLLGAAGNDILVGGAGTDTLTGGANNDSFRFDVAVNAANRDTIVDFVVVNDTIQLENAFFTGLTGGTLKLAQFHKGTAAHDADDRIIYNATAGTLTFDSNGNAAGGATVFTNIGKNLAMTNADFFVF